MNSKFTALWSSQAASNLADGLLAAAAPLLIAAITRQPLLVAGMAVAQFLPWLLFTLPAGALTDRVDRRLIIIGGNLLRATGFGLLAASLALGWHSVWPLYAAVFVAGTAETLVDNAALTVPPRLVPRQRLERANGRLFATQTVMNTFVGPPVGAYLAAIAAGLAFASGSALFAVAGGLALLLPRLRPEADPAARPRGRSLRREVAEGWRFFWRHRLLRRVAFISAAYNYFSMATSAVMVLLVTGPLDIPARYYGLFLAVPAAGAVLGSLIAEKLIPWLGGGPIIWISSLVPAANFVVMGLSDSPTLILGSWFLAGITSSTSQIVVSTLRQAAVPDAMLGRVTSAYRLIVLGVIPLGALSGGLISSLFGLRTTFVTAGIAFALVTLALAPRITTAALRDAEVGGGRTDHPEPDQPANDPDSDPKPPSVEPEPSMR